jgi:hypothetical protein
MIGERRLEIENAEPTFRLRGSAGAERLSIRSSPITRSSIFNSRVFSVPVTPTVPAVSTRHVRFDHAGLADVDERQVLIVAGMPAGEGPGLGGWGWRLGPGPAPQVTRTARRDGRVRARADMTRNRLPDQRAELIVVHATFSQSDAPSSPWCKSRVAPRPAMRPAGKARGPRMLSVFEAGLALAIERHRVDDADDGGVDRCGGTPQRGARRSAFNDDQHLFADARPD